MTPTDITSGYPEPSPQLIEDIRKRLAKLPTDVLERVHHAFVHDPIQEPGSILWKAGVCLTSHELYEYRKTFFPPNSLIDPDTQGRPVLRKASALRSVVPDPEPRTANSEPLPPSADSEPLMKAQQSTNPLIHPSIAPPIQSSNNPLIHQSTALPGATLLNDLRSVINRYVVLPPMAAEALALWVLHTYAFGARNVTVYIGIVSPEKRCGKTTLLTLLGNLANRSLVAANITPSALFRVIEETQPTLLIDEADTFLQTRDELRGILNAGYKRDSAYVVRVVSKKPKHSGDPYASPDDARSPDETEWTPLEQDKNGTRVVRHSCWCPKVIAAIGRLPDTLADRCIVITMQRKTASEVCERMRDLNAAALRSQCAQFVREHRDAIAKAQPALPPNLNDRAADIWEPLLAIADIAGGDWPDLARKAALKLSSGDDEPTLLGYFLHDLRAVFHLAKADRMFSRDIVELLNPFHDRPWEDLRRGREINEWWLGQHLRELGIRSRTVWIGDVSAKGYLLEDFEEAFHRYCPAMPKDPPPPKGDAVSESPTNPQLEAQFTALMDKLLDATNPAASARPEGTQM